MPNIQELCKITFGLAALLSVNAHAAEAGPAHLGQQVSKLSWSADSPQRLQAAFPDAESVTRLVKEVAGKPDDFGQVQVKEYLFADLEATGQLDLICTVNFGGTAWNSTLLVISKSGDALELASIDSNGGEIDNLPSLVVDLDHDGRREIEVRTLLHEYARARPTPTFTHIYKFVAGRLYRADAEFPSFYKGRAAALRGEIERLRRQPPSADSAEARVRQDQINALQEEADMISKTIGN
jgi:hypothetical protein